MTEEGASSLEEWEDALRRGPEEGWGVLESLYFAPAWSGMVADEIYQRLAAVETTSPRGMALIGLVLARHHQTQGTAIPWGVKARILAGQARIDAGRVREACDVLLARWGRKALYDEIAGSLEETDPAATAYFYGSLVVSTIPYQSL